MWSMPLLAGAGRLGNEVWANSSCAGPQAPQNNAAPEAVPAPFNHSRRLSFIAAALFNVIRRIESETFELAYGSRVCRPGKRQQIRVAIVKQAGTCSQSGIPCHSQAGKLRTPSNLTGFSRRGYFCGVSAEECHIQKRGQGRTPVQLSYLAISLRQHFSCAPV